MEMNIIISIFSITLKASTSLIFATLGGIYTEKSGVQNLGVEGIMAMGAVTGFIIAKRYNDAVIGVVFALLVGGILACIHAFISITLCSNQVVSGLALTLFGTGLANFMGINYVGQIGPKLEQIKIPFLSDLPFFGEAVFNNDFLVYIIFIVIPLSSFFIYRTRPGLNLRCTGEDPYSADAMGINVIKIRYLYTIIGGMLAGVGGAHLSLSYTPGWVEGLTAGRGWIAIALIAFSSWDPLRAFLGSCLYGSVSSLQFHIQMSGTLIPSSILSMIPYLNTFAKNDLRR